MIGAIVLFLLMLWSVITMLLMISVGEVFTFLRSMYFPLICVGYVLIMSIYPIYKRVSRQDEGDYYYR